MQRIAHFISKNVLFDIAKGSTVTLALFTAYIVLVFAGPLTGIFAPFPVLYYALKNGRGVGGAIVLIVTLSLLLFSPSVAIFYLLQCGLFSLLLAEWLGRGKNAAGTITYTLAIILPVILLIALAYGLMSGTDINTLVVKGIDDAVIQTGEYYQKMGMEGEDLEVLQQGLKQVAAFLGKTYPSFLMVCLAAVAGFNLLLLRKLSWRIERQLNIGDFTGYKNPEKMVWVLILSGFALLINNDVVSSVALNLLVVSLSLYFIQGLSIAGHFFNRFKIHRLVRFIFYLLLILQPYLVAAVAAAGLFDLWCDFRTPKKKENL